MHQTENLLVTVEKQFPERYREYYGIKRQNFFAGVTNFADFWACFMRLDDIFMREFDDVRVGDSDPATGADTSGHLQHASEPLRLGGARAALGADE
jgi:hypothetical protein